MQHGSKSVRNPNSNTKVVSKYQQNYEVLKVIKHKKQLREQNPSDNEFIWRKLWYKQHLDKLRNIKPGIDSNDPMVSSTYFRSTTIFGRRLANSIRIERENATLLKKMHTIFTGKSSIDTKLQSGTKCTKFQNKLRKDQMIKEAFENSYKFQRLQEVKPFMSRDEDLKWYKEQEEHMQRKSKYPLYWKSKLFSPTEALAEYKSLYAPRPIVYFDIELENIIIDRIFIELFADICPTTSENFRLLCTNKNGPNYKCSLFNKIWPNVLWRCEAELESGFGKSFDCENFKIKHDAPGIISMISYGPKTIDSGFMISARPLPSLNGKYVGFGKIAWGIEFLNFVMTQIAYIAKTCKPTIQGKPMVHVTIVSCGEINQKTLTKIIQEKLAQEIDEKTYYGKLFDRLNKMKSNTGQSISKTKSNSRQSTSKTKSSTGQSTSKTKSNATEQSISKARSNTGESINTTKSNVGESTKSSLKQLLFNSETQSKEDNENVDKQNYSLIKMHGRLNQLRN